MTTEIEIQKSPASQLADIKIQDDQEQELDILQDFEVIIKETANDIHPVIKYRSKSTGLTVVHASIPGPIVHGYIVLATRAGDDDGLPHTLEHLVFLGSEEYPYKGVLDTVASKCFASQNAWTDVDHTCYTITTAGHQGFCEMLPIYLDHVFYPILSEEAFTTEVYHVNGEGLDGGVVYSEIQAKENTGEDQSYQALVRSLYPETSGYYWQTGGVLKNLREDCTNANVKAFHKKYYNSKNCCLVICGMVPPAEIFKALEPIVKKIIKKGDVKTKWNELWLDEIPKIEKDVEKTLYFPSEDDEEVLFTVGFQGPSASHEVEKIQSIRLLLEYFTDSTVGSLQQDFVENEDPLASSINYAEIENSKTAFYLELESVPKERMNEVIPHMRKCFEKNIESFDLQRMRDIIKKNYLEELSAMENTPANSIAYSIIGDFLYGNNDAKKFKIRLSAASTIKEFLTKDASFWTNLIKECILGEKWVSIFAISSEDEQKKLANEEEIRVSERVKVLGKEGLKKLSENLELAIAKNDADIPLPVLESFWTPSMSSIGYHNIIRHQDPEFIPDSKCKLLVDDITSNFIYVTVLMDTSKVNEDHRKYLALFCEALCESPLKLDDGTILGYEEVVTALNRDLISYSTGFGIDSGGRFKCGSFSHILAFHLQIELEKASEGFDWIRKILWNVQFNGERLMIIGNKMSNDVTKLKRKGNRIALTMMKDILYKAESNVNRISCFRQQAFLKDLSNSLPAREKKLAEVLEGIRKICTDPNNMTIHISTNLEKVKMQGINLNELLLKSLPFSSEGNGNVEKRLANEFDTQWMKNIQDLVKTPKEYLLGIGGEDSSFLVTVSPGISNYDDPDLPALLVAMQYFCQMEGPFYRAIRGGGFAYDFYMHSHIYENLIYFHLYRCTDAVGAWKSAAEVIKAHLNDDSLWNLESLETCKSSLIYEIIETEKTPLSLSLNSLFAYYHKVPGDHSRKQIEKLSKIDMSQLKAATEKYLGDLFMKRCNSVLVCPVDKLNAISNGFKGLDKKYEILTSLAACPLSKF